MYLSVDSTESMTRKESAVIALARGRHWLCTSIAAIHIFNSPSHHSQFLMDSEPERKTKIKSEPSYQSLISIFPP